MLENIRENSQGPVAKGILGLIILTFAVAGIGGYTSSVDTSVAEVNGEKVSQREFDQAYQAQRNRMMQQFGDMFDTLAADPAYMANFRKGVLDNIINEKLLNQNVQDLALRVSDEQIKDTIREMPEFQLNGVFDNNRYLAVINQAGFFQSSDFRDYLRIEMTRRQLSQALVGSEFSLPYQTSQLTALQNQTRDIAYATISAEQFKEGLEVTDEEIAAYYQDNQLMFENQEKVKVDYVTLNVAEIASGISVSDDEVSQYYQDNMEEYRTEEQRRISHILIEFGDDESAAEQKAAAVLARLQAGEDFAELAKTESADTFSGENGGDLEWIEPGVMDEAFDEAAFALTEAGQITDLVKTGFGYHIIKLTELKAAETTAFEEVKEQIAARLASDKAQNQFFEMQQELARVSFEFPDSLDDAAEVINGSVQTSEWLARGGNPAPFDSNKVIDAAFSDLVLQENLNSDVIEVNNDMVMVVRMNEYQEANVKPLSEVKARITDILVNEKATEKAATVAQELIAKLVAGESISDEVAGFGGEFVSQAAVARFGGDIDGAIVRKAFVLPHPVEGSVSAESVNLPNGDLALVQVTAVQAGEAQEIPNLAEQKANQLAQSAFQGYVESLKASAEIKQSEAEASNSF